MAVLIMPGEIAAITFQWQNNGVIPFSPIFQGKIVFPPAAAENATVKMAAVTSPVVNPGEISGDITLTAQVPTSWLDYNNEINVYLMAAVDDMSSPETVFSDPHAFLLGGIENADISIVNVTYSVE